MTTRIDTGHLVGFLTDLLATASDDADVPGLRGVLVHTCRGGWGSDPGQVDLLAGVSTNRFIAGHTWTYVDGQLGDGPMWWDRTDVKALLAVLKPLSTKPEHAVTLSLSGGRILVEEDPDLFGEGFSCEFPFGDGADFPGQGVYRLLASPVSSTYTRVDAGEITQVEPRLRTDLSSYHLAPFLAVGKRRGGLPLQMYRGHQYARIAVQIGDNYLGAIIPDRYDPEADADGPTVEVLAPEFPDTPNDDDQPGDDVMQPKVDATARNEDADDPVAEPTQ
jgi:S-DNA-T family DNA segregation ATPase FtsK/SpoIIIE